MNSNTSEPGAPVPSKILVIDDDPIILEVLQNMLENRCDKVMTASNADEAITQIIDNRSDISLIICDYVLPRGSGFWVRQILEYVSPKTPFILYSGVASESKVRGMFADLDVSDFVTKGDCRDLDKSVRRVLNA